MRAATTGAVKRDVTRALYVAALALGRTRDPGQVVRAATAEMQRAVGAEAVALYLLDSGRQRLVLREAVGPTPGPWEQVALGLRCLTRSSRPGCSASSVWWSAAWISIRPPCCARS
jgi:hypothetical protein